MRRTLFNLIPSSAQRRTGVHISAFNAAAELERLTDHREPRILRNFQLDGPAMLGVIKIAPGSTRGFWERHDGGDELLVILRGKVRFTVRKTTGDEQVELGTGDVLVNDRGIAHGAEVMEELHILFITPRAGNVAWTDDPTSPGRHD